MQYVDGYEYPGAYEYPGDGGGEPSGEEVLGALRDLFRGQNPFKHHGGPAPRPRPQHPQRKIFRRPPLPAMPAQPNPSELRAPMGLPVATWAPGDGTDKQLIITLQESFRGERLVFTEADAGGTFAGIVLLRQATVGVMPQTPSIANPMPISMFSPQVTYSNMDFQVAYRGTQITFLLGVTAAPAAGITVTVSGGLYGQWIR